jgi:hypothetical protein
MNKKSRKRISDLRELLGWIRMELDELRDTEQEKYDNLPETFHDGEQGERLQEAIDALDEASYSIEAVEETLEGISNE